MKTFIRIIIILIIVVSSLILVIINIPYVKDLIALDNRIYNEFKTIPAPKLKYDIIKNFNNNNIDYIIVQSDDCPIGRKLDLNNIDESLDESKHPEIYHLALKMGYRDKVLPDKVSMTIYPNNKYIGIINSPILEFGCRSAYTLAINTTKIEIK